MPPARLTPAQARLLAAVAQGDTLKVHRTLDGAKGYRLHPLAAAPAQPPQAVAAADVEALVAQGLLASNMKFPAAAFLLTDRGSAWLRAHAGRPSALQVRNYD
jgi:hypothetical protein